MKLEDGSIKLRPFRNKEQCLVIFIECVSLKNLFNILFNKYTGTIDFWEFMFASSHIEPNFLMLCFFLKGA